MLPRRYKIGAVRAEVNRHAERFGISMVFRTASKSLVVKERQQVARIMRTIRARKSRK